MKFSSPGLVRGKQLLAMLTSPPLGPKEDGPCSWRSRWRCSRGRTQTRVSRFTQYCLLQAFLKKPLLGINCWTFHQLTRGPSYQKGVRHLTGASWSKLHHGRLPANFGQSEATFLFILWWRHSKNVKLRKIYCCQNLSSASWSNKRIFN